MDRSICMDFLSFIELFEESKFLVLEVQSRDKDLSGFIKKYLHLCFKDEGKSYGLEHEGE